MTTCCEYKISVIVPVHNRVDLVARALDSIYQQTLLPHEVIVIDDGSDDGTGPLIQQRYPSVIYRYQAKHGVSHARNRGIGLATGNWIALLDSDDQWQRDKLQKQVSALKKNQQTIICHSDEIWIRRGKRVNPMKKHRKQGGELFYQCLELCAISPSAVMINRDYLLSIGLFDEDLPVCEDYDLWLRICSTNPVLYVDEQLVIKYGGHADQLSTQYWGMDRYRIVALEKLLSTQVLTSQQKQSTIHTILAKCRILCAGALKRKNDRIYAQYQQKLQRYSEAVIN